MLNQPTIEKLHAMRLHGMAEAFRVQPQQAAITELSFEERFGLHLRNGFQELERDQMEARLLVPPLCAAYKTRDVVRGLHADAGTIFQEGVQGKAG